MTISATLTARSHNAAAYIQRVGWTQATEKDDEGRVCETGAVTYCQPRNGDEHLVNAVLRNRGTGASWNDEKGRTVGEVVADLNRDITDADLEATFGPQWVEIVALIRACAGLMEDQLAALDAAWYAAGAAARIAAGDAAGAAAVDANSRYAAWDAAEAAAAGAAGDAASNAAGGAARIAARIAAGDAAVALATRDLIGQHGYTQKHYDILTAPWVSVMGKAHPDDSEVTS